jgi:uncharacterized protein YcbX
MAVCKLTDIIIYPVKSMEGISLSSGFAGIRGFQHDRRWMLVDDAGHFITQRSLPILASLRVSPGEEGWRISHDKEQIWIPFHLNTSHKMKIDIWDSHLDVSLAAEIYGNWFSEYLRFKCHLVYMDESVKRPVNAHYRVDDEQVSFADAFPYLMTGEPSLQDLNARLNNPLPMNRFRPNLVFSGGLPFYEDSFDRIEIGEAIFKAVKPCARCIVTTTDQSSGIRGSEPLVTLSKYRKKDHRILFGQNLICLKEGHVKIGDALHIVSLKS